MPPCAVSTDGAFLTHSQPLVKIPPKSIIDQFLPKYDLGDRLFHPDNPITIAPQVDQDWLTEIRKQNDAAMRRAPQVLRADYKEYYEPTGRTKQQSSGEHMPPDAD